MAYVLLFRNLVVASEPYLYRTDMLAAIGATPNSWSRLNPINHHIITWLHVLMFRCCQMTLVNSTWTRDQMPTLCHTPLPHIIFGPVDTRAFSRLENVSEQLLAHEGQVRILSIGCFRQSKNHRLQLDMFAEVLRRLHTYAVWPMSPLFRIICTSQHRTFF